MCADVADDVEVVWMVDGALYDAVGEPIECTVGGASDNGAGDWRPGCADSGAESVGGGGERALWKSPRVLGP